jgi:pimeloyl-ACP methyl ester carboxylesterase
MGSATPFLDTAGSPDSDEAVVFVHGMPGSAREWDRLIGPAARVVGRALALTLPGFAGVPPPPGFAFTVDAYAAHLAAVLEAQGVRRAHLVLHDFGGGFGLTWAARHPEQVASITLIDTGVLTRYRWHGLARVWRTRGVGEIFNATANGPAFRLLLRRGQPRPLPRADADRLYEDFGRDTRRTALRLYRATDEPLLARFAGDLRRLDPPVLVIWGAHDAYLPVEQAARQREALPRARVEILQDSGHWPHLDDPPAVERLLTGFLAGVASPAHAEARR